MNGNAPAAAGQSASDPTTILAGRTTTNGSTTTTATTTNGTSSNGSNSSSSISSSISSSSRSSSSRAASSLGDALMPTPPTAAAATVHVQHGGGLIGSLPPEVWRRVCRFLADAESEKSPSSLLHLANASHRLRTLFSSAPFNDIWIIAIHKRWPWIAPQRKALGFPSLMESRPANALSVFVTVQCELRCPICISPMYLESPENHNNLKDHDAAACNDCRGRRAIDLVATLEKKKWTSPCPCCEFDRAGRAREHCSSENWTCTFLMDVKEERRFCSQLCGDAAVQIECESDCKTHGCAACFTDGSVKKIVPDESSGVYRGWQCVDELDDNLEGWDDDDAVGFDGIAMGANWWATEAKRCRETGRMFGECVCGECEVYLEAENEVK